MRLHIKWLCRFKAVFALYDRITQNNDRQPSDSANSFYDPAAECRQTEKVSRSQAMKASLFISRANSTTRSSTNSKSVKACDFRAFLLLGVKFEAYSNLP
jgi:hypothetical protein